MSATIDWLIINFPYAELTRDFSYNRETRTFTLKESRRPAGYVKATEGSRSFDDLGVFVEIPLVNQIRWCWRPKARTPSKTIPSGTSSTSGFAQ